MKTDLSGEFQLVSAGRMAPSVLHEVVGVIGELLLLDRLCKFVCSYLIRNPYPAFFNSKGALSSFQPALFQLHHALSVSNQALSYFHQANHRCLPAPRLWGRLSSRARQLRRPSHYFAHPWGADSLVGGIFLLSKVGLGRHLLIWRV